MRGYTFRGIGLMLKVKRHFSGIVNDG